MRSTQIVLIISLLLAGFSCDKGSQVDDNDEGTMTDIEGNVYKTIRIGNQVWTAENLRTTKYNDGTDIPHITDSADWANDEDGAYSYYDNNSAANAEKYGALYNWYALGTEKLAPTGWHVPDTADWNILENYLIANGYNWDGTTARNKIGKSMAAKTDWNTSSVEGDVGNDMSTNNSSGFSALPGGFRTIYGTFYNQGNVGYWWTATENDAYSADGRGLYWINEHLARGSNKKEHGLSVRLVRD